MSDINKKEMSTYWNTGLSINQRFDGLIRCAQLRTVYFNNDPNNKCLSDFIEYLRKHNKRFVNLIFYLANIDNKKHHLKFDNQEKQAIIYAIFQLQALVGLIPKNIVIPL
ncbi:DUF5347 family protein [Arsenophonus nasoniae]|uniref:DUF5347 family protein n=1 Tax=Arsenophonus nasoniae TaxID=638 RepID=D2U2E2_9GAMM|nr:DUF5347 family protein [Arsenophonus nasoniae]QBY42000.1 hypothetical protein ArsFIN_05330 [Arsenophonus nasoniae]WGM06195.1 DUF5347 family protein [Arsenophonus nasoniae]CBA75183.1 conserved hypothetical protein [Arsenophonus nasoniae]